MRSSVPAGAFKKAAMLKRKQQGAEAEGSKKKPRPQSPSAPLNIPRAPTPPPPPRQSPTPTPPLQRSPPPQRSPLPPQRSPTPLPPPRRSPTPLPPRRSPPPSGPISVIAGTSSGGLGARAAQPAGPSTSSAPESTPRGVASAGAEARLASSEPTRDTIGPVPMRPSLMNHSHLAEKLLSAASNSAIREEIRRTDSRTVFKECEAALLRVVNVFNHTQKLAINGESQLRRFRREVTEYKRRVTEAEDALKLARAGEAERLEVVRSQALARAEAANNQMHKALERAVTAEGKLKTAEAELADVKAQLEAAKSELKAAEEKTEIAEEVARLADIKVAEAMASAKAADKKSADAEAAAVAAEGKAAEAAVKAVESYRSSQAFVEEVAGAGADAFLHGYYECRSQALKVFGIEGLRDLEPSEDPEDGEIEQGSVPDDAPSADAAPVPDDAPSADAAPAED